MPMKTQKISRRAALTRTGAVLGAAALADPSLEGAPASSAETPKKNAPFLFCLNTATIRGQKLGLMKEIEVAGKAGYQAIEPWISSIEEYARSGGSLKERRIVAANRGFPARFGGERCEPGLADA